jgi:hypothetical protein
MPQHSGWSGTGRREFSLVNVWVFVVAKPIVWGVAGIVARLP